MARELQEWHVFEVKVSEILVDPRKFTDVVDLASQHRPALVFIDEADDLLKDRSYSPNAAATNEILKAMDGMMGRVPEVVFIAATNNPAAIDAAAKRGGRFTEKIYMPLFDGVDLETLVYWEMMNRNVTTTPDLTPQSLAAELGPSGAGDVVAIVGQAVNYTITDAGRRTMTMDDIRRAVLSVRGG
jgi:transitional endoplasmic reticulum ATPase